MCPPIPCTRNRKDLEKAALCHQLADCGCRSVPRCANPTLKMPGHEFREPADLFLKSRLSLPSPSVLRFAVAIPVSAGLGAEQMPTTRHSLLKRQMSRITSQG